MPHAVSATALAAINASATSEVFLDLLTIDDPGLASPIRVVRNTKNVTSRGNLFVGLAFDIAPANEDPEGDPAVQLLIDNVDRAIVDAVRAAAGKPSCTLEVVLASDPDTVEMGPYPFSIQDAEYDGFKVTALVAFEDILNARYPADSYTPADYPGLFS